MEMNKNLKINRLKSILKISISLILLIIIFKGIDVSSTIQMMLNIDKSLLLVLLSISILKFFTQAINWQFCLNMSDPENKKMSFINIIKTHMIGLALRFFMPGGYATFGKVFYINQTKKRTTFSIMIEKFYIIWIIWFFALWMLVLFPSYIPNFNLVTPLYKENWRGLFLPIAIIVSIAPVVLPFIIKKIILLLHTKMENTTDDNLPAENKLRRLMIKLYDNLRNINPTYLSKNYFRELPKLLISQILFELLTFLQYFILLQHFMNISLSFFKVSFNISLTLIANTIPITFSGLGLREKFSALLLPQIGIPIETAVGASLIIFFLNAVIPALPGLIFIINYNKKPSKNKE